MSSLVHPFEFRKVSDNRGFSKIYHEKKLKSTLGRFLYVTETSEINSFLHSSNQEWSSEALIANTSSKKERCLLNCDSISLILAASQIDQPPQVHRSEEMRWQTYSRRTPCVCRQNPPRPPDRRSSLSVASEIWGCGQRSIRRAAWQNTFSFVSKRVHRSLFGYKSRVYLPKWI